MAATLHSYNLFLNDSEYARSYPVPAEKVVTQTVTPGTVVSCRVAPVKPSPPKDYLWRSVTGAIIFPPIGAVALYRSRRVSKQYNLGEEDKAQRSSKGAKKMSTLAVTIGVCLWLFAITYFLINIEVTPY